MSGFWTDADQAELELLLLELVSRYAEHKQVCNACRPCSEPERWRQHLRECPGCGGFAPLTFAPCERQEEFLEHGINCPRCNPCPSVHQAVGAVLEWRTARVLRSRAERLRAERDRLEAA